jgi:hypothetical protein
VAVSKHFLWVILSAALAGVVAACAPQLVAPYNSDLAQKSSAMEAEVSTWELAMRANAGNADDDPRLATIEQMLNKWRGEAEAMLTLAISNDPGSISCNQAAAAIYNAIEPEIPRQLRSSVSAFDTSADLPASTGCEAALVADIQSGLDDIDSALKYCRVTWIPDAYFKAPSQSSNRSSNQTPPDKDAQEKLTRSCLAEFKEPALTSPDAAATSARHGRAISHVVTTLQAIVYVENRKKAASAAK